MLKKFIISLVILLIGGWAIRFSYLNATAEKPQMKMYDMGEIVEYGTDYFYHSDMMAEGYRIQVHQAEIISTQEYIEKHNISTEMFDDYLAYQPEYIYDVYATIYNVGNTTTGINLADTLLVSDRVRLPVVWQFWDHLYPQLAGTTTFSIRDNTEMEFYFPYAFETVRDQKDFGVEYLENAEFNMCISLYPTKKMIHIIPDNV